jgi:hypothetical protein
MIIAQMLILKAPQTFPTDMRPTLTRDMITPLILFDAHLALRALLNPHSLHHLFGQPFLLNSLHLFAGVWQVLVLLA